MSIREINITGLGFTAEFSGWAVIDGGEDYREDFAWDAIRDDYNAELAALAPEGVSWGWSESGPWCTADTSVSPDEVHERWTEIHDEQLIDFETIARRHEYPHRIVANPAGLHGVTDGQQVWVGIAQDGDVDAELDAARDWSRGDWAPSDADNWRLATADEFDLSEQGEWAVKRWTISEFAARLNG